ncbi:MAG: hypothetical protein K5785_00745 [Nitrosarchaeum sp.]|nr:hypothetical protein [Nitrosarchaeum sp.]
MSKVQITTAWQDYASVKNWKRGLKTKSKVNKLSEKTDEAIRNYMPLFLEFKQKNPDEIIEEALSGKYVVRESLSDFATWLQDIKNKSFNQSVHASYHIIRGFYSHNDINTQKISTPVIDPSKVQTTDDNLPLFDYKEVGNGDEKQVTMELKREFIGKFFDLFDLRYKAIMMCIKDTGADSGDILSWTLDMVRNQEQHERIFIRILRKKTRQYACHFLSKETTKIVRRYERMHRSEADDSDFLFVQSMTDFRAEFTTKYGRQFVNGTDKIELAPLTTHNLSDAARTATRKMEKILVDEGTPMKILRKNQQSPLRPKRFRKVFSDACDYAGIPVDIKRLFMGKSNKANEEYEGKSRQNLEMYYANKLEPILTIYSKPKEISTEEIKKLEDKLDQKDVQYQETLQRMDRMELQFQQKIDSILIGLHKENPDR